MSGALALSWSDMAQWASLTATEVRPAEWRILRVADVAFLAACRDLDAQERAKANNPNTVSEQPLTADVFDAIFQ